MTENKRFTKVEHIFELNDEGIKDNQTRIEYYYALDLIDLLNEFSKENEQLRSDCQRLIRKNKRLQKDSGKLYQLCLEKGFTDDEIIKELER